MADITIVQDDTYPIIKGYITHGDPKRNNRFNLFGWTGTIDISRDDRTQVVSGDSITITDIETGRWQYVIPRTVTQEPAVYLCSLRFTNEENSFSAPSDGVFFLKVIPSISKSDRVVLNAKIKPITAEQWTNNS